MIKRAEYILVNLDIASRFRWLTATRSTVVQTSKVHPGFCIDALETLEKLFEQLVCLILFYGHSQKVKHVSSSVNTAHPVYLRVFWLFLQYKPEPVCLPCPDFTSPMKMAEKRRSHSSGLGIFFPELLTDSAIPVSSLAILTLTGLSGWFHV